MSISVGDLLNYFWRRQSCFLNFTAAAEDLVFHWILEKVQRLVPQRLKRFPGLRLNINVNTYQCFAIPKS